MTQQTPAHEVQRHYRACHLCEAICGLVIETRGEQIAEDGRPRDVRREEREEVRALPVRNARHDEAFDVGHARFEGLTRLGRRIRQ